MPILNQHNRKRLLLNGQVASTVVKHYELPLVSDFCWYVGISSCDAPSYVKDHIPKLILEKIKLGRIKLLLAMEFEAFPTVANLVYADIVIELGIPEDNVIIVMASKDAVTQVQTAATLYNKKHIKTFWYNYFEHKMRDYNITTRHDVHKAKRFLNLNRRAMVDRIHRFLFVGLLKSRNLLDKGYVSFQVDTSWEDVWAEFNNLVPVEYKDEISSINSLRVDNVDLSINYNYPTDTMVPFYESSWFSVVSETYFFNNDSNRFLTEKTFKAIMHKHPFLLITSPNSLELLKEIGYKTFSPFFDESYDNEYDPYKRMTLIVNEVERLCNLSDTEWHKISIELNKICEYNYNVFMNKKDVRDYIVPLN